MNARWRAPAGLHTASALRCVELVGVPAGPELALPEDQVDVALFFDAEGQADVHLRAHRAVPHHLLGRTLGGDHQRHGGRAAKPGDGVGALEPAGSLLGQLSVFIDDDHEHRHAFGWFPLALADAGEVLGAGIQDGDRVGEQRGPRCRGGLRPGGRRHVHPVDQVHRVRGPDPDRRLRRRGNPVRAAESRADQELLGGGTALRPVPDQGPAVDQGLPRPTGQAGGRRPDPAADRRAAGPGRGGQRAAALADGSTVGRLAFTP